MMNGWLYLLRCTERDLLWLWLGYMALDTNDMNYVRDDTGFWNVSLSLSLSLAMSV